MAVIDGQFARVNFWTRIKTGCKVLFTTLNLMMSMLGGMYAAYRLYEQYFVVSEDETFEVQSSHTFVRRATNILK